MTQTDVNLALLHLSRTVTLPRARATLAVRGRVSDVPPMTFRNSSQRSVQEYLTRWHCRSSENSLLSDRLFDSSEPF